MKSGVRRTCIQPLSAMTLSAIADSRRSRQRQVEEIYLEKLITGEWPGTMQLTEPQAAPTSARCAPVPGKQADGTYRLFGSRPSSLMATTT